MYLANSKADAVFVKYYKIRPNDRKKFINHSTFMEK